MNARTLLWWTNVALTGGCFGVLQWCAFFLLQSYLASTALVYLLATAVWLAGSIGGLTLKVRAGEGWWIGAAVAAYHALRSCAVANPYDLRWLPLLLGFVAVMGGWAGRFFRNRQLGRGGSKWLFFVENTGYVGGMLATAAALFWWGEAFLQWAPLALAAACAATRGGTAPAMAGGTGAARGGVQKLRAAR